MAVIKQMSQRYYITFGKRYGVYNRSGILVASFSTRKEAESYCRRIRLK